MKLQSLTTACALAYPIAAHLAITRGSLAWVIVAISLLAAIVLLPGLLHGRLLAWLCAPLVAVGCWLLVRASTPTLPLYVAPVLVPALLAWVFGHTLLAGRTPLIAQFVRLLHQQREEPEPAVWPYARRLTLVWTVLFIGLASINLLLAAFAAPDGLLLASGLQPPVTVPQYWWSWFANIIGYVLVALFFMIEYAYRRRRFPQQPFRNLYDFMRQMTAAMPALLRRK